MLLKRRRRPPNRYELLTCALSGHALVGLGAAGVSSPDDDLVVREIAGQRWHRCLRCDAWTPLAPPADPKSERVPPREDIEVPLRGPLLRDRYVLRLIAVDRAFHVLVLVGAAVAVLFFLGREHALQQDFLRVMSGLYGSSASSAEAHGLFARINHLFVLTPKHLYEIAGVALAYAALEAAEMVGLWLGKRWAEYLTFVATILLVPLEVYELATKPTVTKAVVLVINVAIAVYLLLAKRLFGLRGGIGAEHARRQAAAGWSALEAATVVPNPG